MSKPYYKLTLSGIFYLIFMLLLKANNYNSSSLKYQHVKLPKTIEEGNLPVVEENKTIENQWDLLQKQHEEIQSPEKKGEIIVDQKPKIDIK